MPFFVAAPISTLDPSTAKGADIVIEDRPATEITHSLGKRVAAEGIDVWNPSFDVTPAALIAGIITEKGVVRKTASGISRWASLSPRSPGPTRQRPNFRDRPALSRSAATPCWTTAPPSPRWPRRSAARRPRRVVVEGGGRR